MSTLTKSRIERYLSRDSDPLIITPILSRRQVGIASVDVRLGNQFIVFRMHNLTAFPSGHTEDPKRIQERLVLRYGMPFILHPGTLALAATLEYVKIPLDLECQVEGRSSWARVGLEVATASTVEPGFCGVITLELSNVGSVPLELHPGVRVGQLVFHDAEPIVQGYGDSRKYACCVGPQFSKLMNDDDTIAFKRRAQSNRDD